MSNCKEDGGNRKPGQFVSIMEYQADVMNHRRKNLNYEWRDVPEQVREMALKLREVAEESFQYGWSLNDLAELSLGMPYGRK